MSEKAKEITVCIKALSGPEFSVKVNPNCTVQELVKKAASSILKSRNDLNLDSGLKLMFSNITLTNKKVMDRPISDYIIANNPVIWYVLSTCKNSSNITFREALEISDLTNEKFIDRPISDCNIKNESFIRCGLSLAKGNGNITFREALEISEARHNNLQLSPLKIIVGIADLLLLAAAVTTFLLYFLTTLSLSVAVPIVLAALFVTFAVLFLGWNTILPDNCLKEPDLGIDLNEEYKNEIKETENNKENNPEPEEEKKDEKEENKDN